MPTVETLNRLRPDYAKKERDLCRRLYEGGESIAALKEQILPQRPAEDDNWYAIRQGLFSYMNRAAQIVDEMVASVFQGELQFVPELEPGGTERPKAPDFYSEFTRNPRSSRGSEPDTLVDVLYEGMADALVERDAFFLVSFPQEVVAAKDRASQEAAGALRAFVRCVDSDTVIDLEEDDQGLAWVMLRHRICDRRPLVEKKDLRDKVRWTLIDREQIQAWEIEVKPGEEPKPKSDAAEVLGYPQTHRWAEEKCVPIVRLRLGRSVWMLNRICSLLVAETRKRNALDYYEDLCCFPQPVHAGDETLKERREADPKANTKRGAAYFFEIEKEGKLEYLEPSGASLAHLAKRIEQLGIEIAQITHNMASSLGPEAAAQMQSAASKVRDSVAKRLLAGAYADTAKKCAASILKLVSIGRGETDLEWQATGLDQHDIADASLVVDEALKVNGLAIPSVTFRREHSKATARAVLADASVETLEKIDREIDSAKIELNAGDEEEDDDPKGGGA